MFFKHARLFEGYLKDEIVTEVSLASRIPLEGLFQMSVYAIDAGQGMEPWRFTSA